MGQAKRRGDFEHRRHMALIRNEANRLRVEEAKKIQDEIVRERIEEVRSIYDDHLIYELHPYRRK